MSESGERLVREIWLRYFNRFLRDEGLLTQEEYLRMDARIRRGGPSGAGGG